MSIKLYNIFYIWILILLNLKLTLCLIVSIPYLGTSTDTPIFFVLLYLWENVKMIEKTEKIALVIEGGGFKSIFTAGVLDAFLINKFNPFDIYLGVSSGSMCLSYYVSNQYKTFFSLSQEVSLNEKFVNYSHVFSEQGYMDLKYLEKTLEN